MIPNDCETLLLSSDLGPVGNCDPATPLARLNGNDPLRDGQIYLRLTLKEMIRIRNMSKNSHHNHHTLLRETRAVYDNLVRQRKDLENFLEKRGWMIRFFRRKKVKRLIQAFIADTFELYESTKTESDVLMREVLSIVTAEHPPAEGKPMGNDEQIKVKSDKLNLRSEVLSIHTKDCPPAESQSVGIDEQLNGVSVDFGGPVTQEALTIFRDAVSYLMSANSFTDTASSESQNGGTSASETETLSSTRCSVSTMPSSPGSASSFNSLNLQLNCINTKNTNCTGLTIINGGSGNSGSCIIGVESVDPGSLTSV